VRIIDESASGDSAMITRTQFDSIVARLAKVLGRRLEDSIILKGNREEVDGLPGTIENLLRGQVMDMLQESLPGQMEKAKGHSTEDDTVIDLRISAESFVQDFSCLFPALSAFLVSVHWGIKREGGPEVLWTPRMEQLTEQLASVSSRWLEIANRKVRGKTAQTKWLLEVSRVLAEANAICVDILTAIVEAGIDGEPW
jgi:hypothetical protein